MISIPARARTGKDGSLALNVNTPIPDSEVEVVIVVNPVREAKLDENGYPEGFFQKTFGVLADSPLERQAQGDFEVREPLR